MSMCGSTVREESPPQRQSYFTAKGEILEAAASTPCDRPRHACVCTCPCSTYIAGFTRANDPAKTSKATLATFEERKFSANAWRSSLKYWNSPCEIDRGLQAKWSAQQAHHFWAGTISTKQRNAKSSRRSLMPHINNRAFLTAKGLA